MLHDSTTALDDLVASRAKLQQSRHAIVVTLDSLLDLLDEKIAELQSREALQPAPLPTIKLDVRGKLFEVPREVLLRSKYFMNIFCYQPRYEGVYFLDINPVGFTSVLKYIRNLPGFVLDVTGMTVYDADCVRDTRALLGLTGVLDWKLSRATNSYSCTALLDHMGAALLKFRHLYKYMEVCGEYLHAVNCTRLSLDKHSLASGCCDGTVCIWNLDTGGEPTIKMLLTAGTDSVEAMIISQDLSTVVTIQGNSIYVWDFPSAKLMATLTSQSNTGIVVCLSEDNSTLLAGGEDFKVMVWKVAAPASPTALDHDQSVIAVCVSSDNSLAVTGTMDQYLRVWNLEDGLCTLVLEGHSRAITSLYLDPNGFTLVSASKDRTVRVWDISAAQCLTVLRLSGVDFGQSGAIERMWMSADRSTVVTSTPVDAALRVWDLATSKCLATLPAGPRQLQVTLRQRRLLNLRVRQQTRKSLYLTEGPWRKSRCGAGERTGHYICIVDYQCCVVRKSLPHDD